jgi:thiazolinyl imide reductase
MPVESSRPGQRPPRSAIVCGTTFGQVYLEGLKSDPAVRLAGILARDSERSRSCSQYYGVPLFTRVDDLPDVELACVVVRSALLGGEGSELAQRLMTRGIHVLQEHPVHHDELADSLRHARRCGVQYHLNTFYPHLPEVRRFVRTAGALVAVRPALYLDAACSFQVAYALLDILRTAVGKIGPWRFEAVPRTSVGAQRPTAEPLRSLDGALGGVPLSLRIQHQLHPVSPDDFSYLLHRITLGTEAGELTLVTTHGPLLWCGRPAVPREVLNPHETRPYSSEDFQTDDVCATLLSPGEVSSQRRLFREDWPVAARRAVHELCAAIEGEQDPLQRGQHHLTLCRIWQQITGTLGAPELLKREGLPRSLAPRELLGLRMAANDPER